MMRTPAGAAFVVAWFALMVAGCAPFQPEPGPEGPASRPVVEQGETALALGNLEKKQVVDLRGQFDDGVFVAVKIELKDADNDVELKSTLDALDAAGNGRAGGVAFRADEKTRLVSDSGEPLEPGSFKPGDWVKVEAREEGGALILRKLTRRERKPGEPETLQGPIGAIQHKRGRITIPPGIEVKFDQDVLVVWDDDAPPPAVRGQLSAHRTERYFKSGIPTIRRDEERARPPDQLRIADLLIVGGEVKAELELRDNFRLDENQRRDRMIAELSSKLEFTADLARNMFGYAEFRLRYEDVLIDQSVTLDDNTRVSVGELFVLVEDVPLSGLALQVGRQDFDHGREWVMDESVDAARLYVNLAPALLELSVGQTLFDTTPENDGVTNLLAALHLEPFEDHDSFVYALYREGGELDLDRMHFGVSLNGSFDCFEYWADLAGVLGGQQGHSIAGFGFDVAAMYVLEDDPLEPSVYAGLAYGSGDDDPDVGGDDNFRQTGLNDNNDRFNGLVSFRYLGELTRFEVSNLIVATAGFGVRVTRKTSIDFVYHHYRQVEAAPFLGDTRLRAAPNGKDASLGTEFDLIFGFKEEQRFRFELNLAWFFPGDAFERDDPAFYLFASAQFNF